MWKLKSMIGNVLKSWFFLNQVVLWGLLCEELQHKPLTQLLIVQNSWKNMKSLRGHVGQWGSTDLHFSSPQPNTSSHCNITNMACLLYCLTTEAHPWEGHYSTAWRPGLELATTESPASATRLLSHPSYKVAELTQPWSSALYRLVLPAVYKIHRRLFAY